MFLLHAINLHLNFKNKQNVAEEEEDEEIQESEEEESEDESDDKPVRNQKFLNSDIFLKNESFIVR
jgi:hypothetical protein